MKKTSKIYAPDGDPKLGDEILKRMLQTKPKPHAEIVKSKAESAKKRQPKG